MLECDLRHYLGRNVEVAYRDHRGDARMRSIHVQGISFTPSHGYCLIGDTENVLLDEVASIIEIQ